MNKYLREFFIHSRIPPLVRLGYKDLRKKFAKRHAAFQSTVRDWLFPDGPPTVLHGPFKGMPYLDEVIWGSITPRWIGSYERELWEAIENLIELPYDCVIDVGCAEGYYATGLAWKIPTAQVFAYDLDPFSREQCRRLWELNGSPGNLTVLPWCDAAEVRKRHGDRTLVVVDIEGGEMGFLSPTEIPELVRSDILVEVHRTRDKEVAENAELLRKRFADTHAIQTIETAKKRDPSEYTFPDPLPDRETVEKSFSEGRPYAQCWLWMRCDPDAS